MATTRGISFESFESLSVSHRLGRLVEAQLSEARQRTSTHRPEALGDLRAMVDALSSLSTICTTVLDDICARGQKRKPSAAVKEIENVFEWTECSSPVRLVHAL
jgi:hypothetical protein